MNRRGASSLPPDVRVSISQIRGLIEDLDDFLLGFKSDFGQRSESRETGCQYIKGLIANIPRKSAEPIAEIFGKDRKCFQRFVGTYQWIDDDVRRKMLQELKTMLEHPDGVLIFDPSAFPKQGNHSVGVKRQWCGAEGKTDNCQVGCFVSYASPNGSCIVDAQLYLPEEWAKNDDKRRECHVPPDIQFKKKWEIAIEMLDKCRFQLIHSIIMADSEFGRCGDFRDHLSRENENYLLDIPKNLEIRVYKGNFLIPAPTTPEKWALEARPSAWKKFDIRNTNRGVLLLEGMMTRVITRREDNTWREEILVVKKEKSTGEVKYGLANERNKSSLRRLLQDWSRRHTVEECFQRGKSDLGMDHYEVRSWVGWHHHMTLTMLAMCFLEKEKIKKSNFFSPSNSIDHSMDDG
ncbi:MAG: IS701 family transposase [Oligoflexia bacterium]|nr:IS701 family transposase [Oligoflexia bacterium]